MAVQKKATRGSGARAKKKKAQATAKKKSAIRTHIKPAPGVSYSTALKSHQKASGKGRRAQVAKRKKKQ